MQSLISSLGSRVRAGLAVATLIGAAVLAFAPASSADPSPSQADIANVADIATATVIHGTSNTSTGDVTPLSSCAVTEYGYTGYRVCEFAWLAVTHPNGSVEYFV